MKIVFFGSSEFSVASLKALIARHEIIAVYTQPDRKKGRNLQLSETPVKVCAKEHGIIVFQPENLSAPEEVEQLRTFSADLFVVVSYGQKLSREVLDIPKRFCVNVHSSLLPRWRGAAPINYAILHGDEYSGVTIMKMNEYMDAGEMILSRSIKIDDSDAVELGHDLADMGAELLVEAIDQIEQGSAEFIVQQDSEVTVAKKLNKQDGLMDWNNEADILHNQVRGLLPWPCAFTHFKDKLIKILKTKVADMQGIESCGKQSGVILAILKHQGIIVSAGNCSALLIETLQPEGKKPMNAYDFVLGHDVKVGDIFICRS